MSSVLTEIADALRAEGGLLADHLASADGLTGIATPLADRAGGERGLVIEAVEEGWRLHAEDPERPPRLIETADRDLALLAGDRLYALGLARLADAGDLTGIAVLTDVIAQAARARLEVRPEAAREAFARAAETLSQSQ